MPAGMLLHLIPEAGYHSDRTLVPVQARLPAALETRKVAEPQENRRSHRWYLKSL